jgi:small subunit ribosomal protein S18
MAKRLFVSNLDFEVNSEQLQQVFAEIAPVMNVSIAQDRETKRSKGFAFVDIENDDGAQKAIDSLNGKLVNGRPIKVVLDRGKTGSRDAEGGEGARTREYLPSIQRMQIFRRKKKLDPFLQDPSRTIDYKDVAVLNKFVSERGKVLSRRLTGLSAYNQRKVAKAIKRAQNLGIMSFTTVQQS